MRPLLLLDIDGVLSPIGRAVPRSYERHTSDTYDVVISPAHGTWIRPLLDMFEGTWVTTWGNKANIVYAPLLGLPALPVLPLGDLPREGTRKLAAVREYVGDRPLAWIDDELYDDATAWSASRTAPTLLVRPAPSVGLTRDHTAQLAAFSDALR